MPLRDKYVLPSAAILESRRRITAPTLVIPWNEAEEAAGEYNAKIEASFNKCQPSAKVIKKVQRQVKKNLRAIAETVKLSVPDSYSADPRAAVDRHIRQNPKELVAGLEDMFDLMVNVEFGRRALEPLVDIHRTGFASVLPISFDPYFSLLSQLDEYQVIAIDNGYRVVILLAGAGSGKTRTVESWVRVQIQTGTKDDKILCVSFSDDSMKVMRERIHKEYPEVNIYTFHALSLKMISQNAGLVRGFENMKVLDDVDQKCVLRKIISDLGAAVDIDDTIRLLQGYALQGKQICDDPTLSETQKRIADAYRQEKQRRKTLDFNDMILLFHKTLTENSAFREKVSGSFSVIAFDEVQDSFSIFIDCLKMIYNDQKMIIVGDPSQRIFGFAGSTVNSFKEIQEKIGGELMVLPYNHRSAPDLVHAMDRFIRTNPREIVRPVISAREVPDD